LSRGNQYSELGGPDENINDGNDTMQEINDQGLNTVDLNMKTENVLLKSPQAYKMNNPFTASRIIKMTKSDKLTN
jgi:hypothetical protein